MRNSDLQSLQDSVKKYGVAEAVRRLPAIVAAQMHHAFGGADNLDKAAMLRDLTCMVAEYSEDTPLVRDCQCEPKALALVWKKATESKEQVSVYYPPSLEPWLYGPVQFAVDFWNSALPDHAPLLKLTEDPSADIRVSVKYIDGPGKTLGVTYVPSNGDDMDVAGWSGDIYLDVQCFRWRQKKIDTVTAHEMGHALGMPHSDTIASIMYPSYTGPHSKVSAYDKKIIRDMYGEFFVTGEEPDHCSTGE